MKKIKFILILFIILTQFFVYMPYSNASNTTSNSQTTKNSNKISTYSPTCILMEAKTGKILYEKNAYKENYPASTTKIMTAILTLENCELTDVATVSHNAIFSVPASYSVASLREGEKLTIEQLLNVLLIPSANDAANVLAEHVSGSVEEFAKLMNKKAKEIGCKNTNFVNPNGVHNEKHKTTAYDLALIGRYAMQNSTFRKIVKKTSYTLPKTNKYSKTDRAFTTTNDLIRKNTSTAKDNYYYPNAIGIKTGYTSNAGSCIVAGAEKDGLEMIVVILGGETTKDGLSERNLDCINLFNYAFENYQVKTFQKQNSVIKQLEIKGATTETKNLNVIVKDEISAFIGKDEAENLQPEIVINDELKAPISANSVVGTISYKIDGETYSSDLIAETSVIASDAFPLLIRIGLIFITIVLIYFLLRRPKNSTPSKSTKHSKKRKAKHSKSRGNFKFTTMSNLQK